MQYFIKKIQDKTKNTDLEHYTLELIDKIHELYERLKDVEKHLPKSIKQQSKHETLKEFFEKLLWENQEDRNILEAWLKEYVNKALGDKEFCEKYYLPTKQALEITTDRESKIKAIVNQNTKQSWQRKEKLWK